MATTQWIDKSGSGNWSDGFNWNTGTAPTAGRDVTIDTGATVETVTYDGAASSVTIATLTTGAKDTLVVNASGLILAVSGAATLGGALSVNNGTLEFDVASTVAGLYTQSGGTLSGTGTVTLNGGADLSGALTMSGTGKTLLASSTTSTFGSGTLDLVGGRILQNDGQLHTTGDAEIHWSVGSFVNNGTVIVDSGQMTLNSQPSGLGTFGTASGATFTLDGSSLSGVNIHIGGNNGAVTLIGGTGTNNFGFGATDLHATDTVTGTSGSGDTLNFYNGAQVSADAFAHVSGIDRIQVLGGSGNIAFDDALVATANQRYLLVSTSNANVTVDASAVTDANNRVSMSATGVGSDAFVGGAGDDYCSFTVYHQGGWNSNFGGASGGAGRDTLSFAMGTSSRTLSTVTGIEVVNMEDGGVHGGFGEPLRTGAVTIPDSMVSSAEGHTVTFYCGGGNHNNYITAENVTAGNRVIFVDEGDSYETLRGGAGNDIFKFYGWSDPDVLSSDSVTGGGGKDQLTFTSDDATALPGILSGIETINLFGGTNQILLDDGIVSSALDATVRVYGASGNDTIDASAVHTATNTVIFLPNAGTDTLKGGAGNDTFQFNSTFFDQTDTVNGGGGNDTLALAGVRTLAASDFGSISSVEVLSLAAGPNHIALADAMVGAAANATLTVLGNTGGDTVDASAVTSAHHVVFNSGTGKDTLTGGAGGDTFEFAIGALDSFDHVNGGGGNDTLKFTAAGTITADGFAHLSSIEGIALSNGTGNNLTLSDGLVARADNDTLRVNGGTHADTIDASAVGTGRHVAIHGGRGADITTAGRAIDQFFFSAASDSTSSGYDTITGMNLNRDSFRVGVSGTLTASGALHSGANFDSEFAADIGTVAGHSGVLLTVTASGGTGGSTFVFVDLDGSGHYEAGNDLVIRLVNSTGTFGINDFV